MVGQNKDKEKNSREVEKEFGAHGKRTEGRGQ